MELRVRSGEYFGANGVGPPALIEAVLGKSREYPSLDPQADASGLGWQPITTVDTEARAEKIAVQVDGTAGELLGISVGVEDRDLDLVLHFLGGLPEFLGGRNSGEKRIGCRLDLAVQIEIIGEFLDNRQRSVAAIADVAFASALNCN